MIRVIDARSGRDVKIGDTVTYPGSADDWWKLAVVTDGLFWASATVHTPRGIEHVRLRVRFTHPAFFLQRVGFFPS